MIIIRSNLHPYFLFVYLVIHPPLIVFIII